MLCPTGQPIPLHIQQGPRCVCVIVVGVDGMGLCAVESQDPGEHVGDGGPLWGSQNNHDTEGQIHGMWKGANDKSVDICNNKCNSMTTDN